MRNTYLAVHLLLLAIAASTARAATWYVESVNGADTFSGTQAQPFQTLSRAIAAAASGDTIFVANGLYVGKRNRDLDFAGKNLIVKSQNGPANCFLDGRYTGRIFSLHSGETTSARIDGFTIRNGWTTDRGGAIALNGSSPTITNCLFSTCHGFDGGGAVYVHGNSSPAISACTFTGNTCGKELPDTLTDRRGGAAILTDNGVFTISNCAFTNNVAYPFGGAISYGGAVYVGDQGNVTIVGCSFSGNSAGTGEGVYSSNHMALANCTFSNHTGIIGGDIPAGAVYLEGTGSVSSCVFTGNSGGVYSAVDGSQIQMADCLFHHNGTGIITAGGSISCVNSTFADQTNAQHSALYLFFSQTTLTNCIMWSPNTVSVQSNSAKLSIDHSDVQGGIPSGVTDGGGNIASDPKFVNPTGSDYHLTAASPCRNAGTAAVALPTTDLDGHPRVQGSAPDMGAYEYGSP